MYSKEIQESGHAHPFVFLKYRSFFFKKKKKKIFILKANANWQLLVGGQDDIRMME